MEFVYRMGRRLLLGLLLIWAGVGGAYIALARGYLPQYGVVTMNDYADLEQQLEQCRLRVKVPLK